MVMLRLKTPVEVVYTTDPARRCRSSARRSRRRSVRPRRTSTSRSASRSRRTSQGPGERAGGAARPGPQAHGQDAGKVDFRQEEVRYAKKFDQIKVPLTCFAMLVLILILLLDLSRFQVYRSQMRSGRTSRGW
jgi:hypothetical protein